MKKIVLIILFGLMTSCSYYIIPEKIEVIIKEEKEYSTDIILPYIKPDTIKYQWWQLPDSLIYTPCIYIDTRLK